MVIVMRDKKYWCNCCERKHNRHSKIGEMHSPEFEEENDLIEAESENGM